MAYQDILYEVDDRVAVITLNRPERMNAFGATVREEMVAAIEEADADDGVRVLVLTGAGGQAFSAGYDIKETIQGMERGLDEWRELLAGEMTFTMAAWDCSKPVIECRNSHCTSKGNEVDKPFG